MSRALRREPGYFGRPIYERQAWQQFGRRRFPNYDRFWQAFVVPLIRPRPLYIMYREGVSLEQRRIIRDHQVIFRLFGSVLNDKPENNQDADWYDGYCFLSLLKRLNLIFDYFEDLLVILPAVGNDTHRGYEVAKQYVQRLNDRQAKIKAHVIERLKLTVRASELKTIHKSYDLRAYDPIAKRIRTYRDTVQALESFNRSIEIDPFAPIPPITKADLLALQSIRGSYNSARELIFDQAYQLLAVINDMYGKQLIPLVKNSPRSS